MARRRARISAVNSYFPKAHVDNASLLEHVSASFPLPVPDVLQRICGIRSRYFAARDEQSSDLAVSAAKPLVCDAGGADKIDLVIFAAACSDLIEPATANIVQYKLGLSCPGMDIKNACNSFVSAIQIASALIENGTYGRVLIVSGEKLSDSIRRHYDSHEQLMANLASLSFGDAGAAMMVEATEEDNQGIIFQRFMTLGQHWELCTIPGGGSMFPHEMDAYYFSGQTAELRDVIFDEATTFWHECRPRIGWKAEEISWVFTHQVSDATFRMVTDGVGVSPQRSVNLFATHGNMAAASIPVCMASVGSQIRRGDKILLVGLAAGVSMSFQALIW
jgi:3-oxoacyl-[acyl-carrier-protein] synthase-3